MNRLVSVAEANALIDEGRVLHIAGDEPLLRQLHRGSWIGGTTPYLLTREGGVVERERVFITELPEDVKEVFTRFIDIGHIPAITTEAPRNGFSIVIVPGMSDIHTIYALTAATVPGIRETPIIGWISGVHMDELGKHTPKVFDGVRGELSDSRIVVMHVALQNSKAAEVGVINVFKPGTGDEIVFHQPSFAIKDCTINGRREDFFTYAVRQKINIELPLVTEFGGEFVNVSFKAIDADSRSVKLFAPVMKERVYRLAAPLKDYHGAMIAVMQKLQSVLACNCYHNYLYGKLEGKQSLPLPCPVVFGEVAHVLMNQTLVYLSIRDKSALKTR